MRPPRPETQEIPIRCTPHLAGASHSNPERHLRMLTFFTVSFSFIVVINSSIQCQEFAWEGLSGVFFQRGGGVDRAAISPLTSPASRQPPLAVLPRILM